MVSSHLPVNEQLSTTDPWLAPYHDKLQQRLSYTADYAKRLLDDKDVSQFSLGYLHFGLHKTADGWVFREWAPAATKIYLQGEFSHWADENDYALIRGENGEWEISLPHGTFHHGAHYKLHVYWEGGDGYRIPAWATYVVQDPETDVFDAVVWHPDKPYKWHDKDFEPPSDPPLIYEAHVGMSSEKEAISTYADFTADVLPRIVRDGYNTIQLMAIAEHPYYGSYGYHVSSFFAPSSRYGTPDDLRALIDAAHQMGLRVIIDLVHSHAVKNEAEGISRFDGTLTQYFHEGDRGNHRHWDSRLFDYGKPGVAHFLLSNCRYWLDEFHIDGYRFDGVTSMLYTHHGIDKGFSTYGDYFADIDEDAAAYLTLANQVIHAVKPTALTIAEDMSGMPGLGAPIEDGGIGFDYRLSMGTPDLWIKYVKDLPDEKWRMSQLFHELTKRRPEEKTISYVESHDQALVGDKTIMFRLADKEMYYHMSVTDENLVIDRAIALHKMIRLLTAVTNDGGYLNFMGNEFGHPEWIDFPRLDNNWSYQYARRQWNLANDPQLKYQYLGVFDHDMISLISGLSGEFGNVLTHDDDHILVFTRGDLVFAFNFHPSKSYADYGVPIPIGDYRVVLSSDDPNYGGFGRINTNLAYSSDGQVKLYMPVRTALVLRQMEP